MPNRPWLPRRQILCEAAVGFLSSPPLITAVVGAIVLLALLRFVGR
jgi:uncharacterized membrane protein YeaQ/YmgE (transglycosylase-associated protein family)